MNPTVALVLIVAMSLVILLVLFPAWRRGIARWIQARRQTLADFFPDSELIPQGHVRCADCRETLPTLEAVKIGAEFFHSYACMRRKAS